MAFEFEILDFFQQIHTPVLTAIMKVASKLGDMGLIWIILAAILLMITKTRKLGILVTIALALDVLTCNVILKPLIARTRPYDINTAIDLLIAAPKDFSFPSGHTASSFAAAAALWFGGKKKLAVPAACAGSPHCFFKNVFLCALSNRRTLRSDFGNALRLYGL